MIDRSSRSRRASGLGPSWSRVAAIAGCLGALALSLAWAAGASGVPMDLQVKLTLRILGYDLNLEERAGDEIVIGIVSQSRSRESRIAAEELAAALEESPTREVDGIPLRWVTIDLDRDSDIEAALVRESVDLVYITALRSESLERILAAARTAHAMTVSGEDDYADQGVSVGIELRSNRPAIILNLHSARAETVRFHTDLYKVAKRVIGRGAGEGEDGDPGQASGGEGPRDAS